MVPSTGGGNASRLLFSGIYAVIDPTAQSDPGAFVEGLLAGGIRVVQVRAKGGIAIDLLDAIVARVRSAGGITIVNDDLALALRADGLHLGQEDAAGLDVAAVRANLGERIIGLSCGTPAEARACDPRAIDYLGVGPMFATLSKADAGGPIGVSGVRAVVAATELPVVAIGGIDLAAIPRVRESGARMAAVLSALTRPSDPARAAGELVSAWQR